MLLNIVDASNLERNLYFTVQLLEMGLPTVVALNMVDVAASQGRKVKHETLENRLGVPVVSMVARKGIGQDDLIRRLKQYPSTSSFRIEYPAEVESAVERLVAILERAGTVFTPSFRWISLMWIERNETVEQAVYSRVDPSVYEQMQQVRDQLTEKAGHLIRHTRYSWIESLTQEIVIQEKMVNQTWSDRVDRTLMHRYLGIPIFLFMMFLVFQLTFSWVGTYLSDQLDNVFSGPVADGLQSLLASLNSPDWFSRLMVDGILTGVGGVLVLVPQIAILFLALSFLEDSGYMSRAAILLDRLMRAIGLNRKSFIPLILGFGCNVPAIMATRVLEDERGRIVTALMAPFMSCSARLSVYSLFVAAFFAKWQGAVVFLLYVTGILVAIGTAFILKKWLSDKESPFLMALPPYRAPMLKSLFLHTWDKAKGFLRKAGTIIFSMSVIVWFLGNYSWHGAVSMENSFLAAVGGFIAPLFVPMGFATWQAGFALLTGFLAKEAVVSTMSITYGTGQAVDMLGSVLKTAFTPQAALAFLFFVLLYTPCLSTVVMMKQETGSWRWTALSIIYSFAVAWVVALMVYGIASRVY
ncbi:ferrous iron transport protein B [Effusibacillus dendaii]|uniref:Ferrous iron transport protein B n=1 Tax=Effusibacillus dendaii TaxID=2743772 RepID=A0A7I8DFU0_9BACL|nr:ferrous iron transport protein B [Effusibacillus dendaii]